MKQPTLRLWEVVVTHRSGFPARNADKSFWVLTKNSLATNAITKAQAYIKRHRYDFSGGRVTSVTDRGIIAA